jgi:insertion element IS1 protein InsB
LGVHTIEITCPRCSARNIKKNGITANSKQRYCCQQCSRQFVIRYSYQGRDPTVRRLIIPLSLNGCGIRDISRVLGVSPNTVLKELRSMAAKVPAPSVPERVIDLQVDELWSFVHNKEHQAWLWYAFEPDSKRIVAWTVGRRTDESCGRLLKQLEKYQVLRFCTDDWESYEKLVPEAHHWTGKHWTQEIERQNLNFRTHLKRLHRKTICYSKSDEMHEAVIKLYIYQHNCQHHL